MFLSTIIVAFLFSNVTAQSASIKTTTIKVNGECNMCKKRIEKAALAVDGIQAAVWDVDTKMLTIKYDESNPAMEENVQKNIAAIGHDTEKYMAPDSAYNNLPGCCHYQRKSVKQ
ncbi:MAG: heavy-metal-associated domain-containing protein [Bacteroidetes bacterium]|nr:heavy-metal-associated domain-containing protein [Bacteroidota bacterium]